MEPDGPGLAIHSAVDFGVVVVVGTKVANRANVCSYLLYLSIVCVCVYESSVWM